MLQIMSFLFFDSHSCLDVRLHTSHGSEIRSLVFIRTVNGLAQTVIIDL